MEKSPCTLMMLDLDGFKYVNDSLGHSVGDELLAAVAVRLTNAVASSGFVARLGGDEFAILFSDCVDRVVLDQITSRIFESLLLPFELLGQLIYVGTSIGIAMSPKDASGIDQLLSHADLALYSAKDGGGGVRVFFTRAMQHRSEERQRRGSELRRAYVAGQFEVWFQPQVCLTTSSISGAEALLRWRHPSCGVLTPQAFIRVLEESAIAEEVGDWIIDQACAAAADWAGAPGVLSCVA